MKIKFFGNRSTKITEEEVNEFIKDKEVIDIKFNTFTLFSGSNMDMHHDVFDRVMVIYKEA